MIKFSINQPSKNKKYTKRVGAYALIKNNEGLIAVIKTDTGYFLPGGGVEGKEGIEECLKRECIEEIGIEVRDLTLFAQGNYFFYSTTFNFNMESVGNFFVCKINKILSIPTEDGHELVWMRLTKAVELLYLASQQEVVRLFEG